MRFLDYASQWFFCNDHCRFHCFLLTYLWFFSITTGHGERYSWQGIYEYSFILLNNIATGLFECQPTSKIKELSLNTNENIKYGSTMYTGHFLKENEYLASDNGKFFAVLQSDQNFVVYKVLIWVYLLYLLYSTYIIVHVYFYEYINHNQLIIHTVWVHSWIPV